MKQTLVLITVCIIFSLGLVMIYNTTSADILDHALEKNTHVALFKQIFYGLCGIGIATLAWRVGYQELIRMSPTLMILFSFLLILCFAPLIGRKVNGSHRWISILGFSMQPSEFVKYIVPAFFMYRYSFYDPKTFSFKDFIKLVGYVSIPLGLILIEPNNGTMGVIAMTLIVFFWIARISFKYWAIPLIILIAIASVSATQLNYVKARLRVYWNPELDLKGKGHQPYQAKIAAGSGQLLGRGPGSSLQKLSYLPEAQNDYIAAIYAEEFGFVGMMVLIALYMLFGYLGFSIAAQARDQMGFYLATCVTSLITMQAFMNLGVVSGLLPSTGLNLPFFSQGGTSLMANLMGVGILLNIEQKSREVNTLDVTTS
jgi:cell division protein FtsW